ncbi:T6SS effector BTH_I2691 family protein [Vibrio zhugei]|uniref:T6SS effector BTH_I2691 family protein n=1 Tax=Vibrio zhugei TaxID=2479546 RepID=A0ABV7CA06_9VIBR|nr:T6SS effector BTH_I2691 family protein [Vibrio zhugei]
MANPVQQSKQNGSDTDPNSPAKSCPVSGEGVAIIPVRYAIDDVDEQGNQLNSLPEEGDWQGPFELEHAKYTMRRLRDGWLYVYDEDGETFHEYQVDGADLIKYDWGADESSNAPEERGSAGESKVYLSYPAKHTLYLGFSYHRWTWRVCEHMRSHAPDRKKWMRKLDLNNYCHSQSLYRNHAGYYEGLTKAVADIDDGGSLLHKDMFATTCTPLKQTDTTQSEPEDLGLGWLHGFNGSDDEFMKMNGIDDKPVTLPFNPTPERDALEQRLNDTPLVKVKPRATIDDYSLPDKTKGVFIALDDPLADLCDLTAQLAQAWAEKERVIGSEQNTHKVRMAEITRKIAAVPVPETLHDTDELSAAELAEHLKTDPVLELRYEERLNQLLQIDYKINQKAEASSSNSNSLLAMDSKTARNIAKMQYPNFDNDIQQLKSQCGIDINKALREQYRKLKESEIPEQARLFDDDGEQGLYSFLLDFYQQTQGKNAVITQRFNELEAAVRQLSKNPLAFGLDNQHSFDQAYFLSMASQVVLMLKNTAIDEALTQRFARLMSLDNPDNLVSLAPFALSKEVWEAIEKLNPIHEHNISAASFGSVGDWGNVLGRIAESQAFIYETRLDDQQWYQALVLPVRKSLEAFKTVYQSHASGALSAIVDNVVSLKSTTTSNPNANALHSLTNAFRVMLMHRLGGSENALVTANHQYQAELQQYQNKILDYQRRLTLFRNQVARGGMGVNDKHLSKTQQAFESEKVQLELDKPEFVTLANQELRNQARTIKEKVLNNINNSKEAWNKLGGLGSLIAVLNVINLISVSNTYEFKNNENDSFDAADRELISTWAWTANAVISVFRDKSWALVQKEGWHKMVISDVLSLEEGKNLANKLIIRTLAAGAFGAVAAALEGTNCWDEIWSHSNSGAEKVLYGFKFGALALQAGISLTQVGLSLAIRSGAQLSLGVMFAPIFVTGLWVAGIVYLLATVLIAIFTLPKMAKWLRQSTWGIDTNDEWSVEEEIKRLENLIYQPNVFLEKVNIQTVVSDYMNMVEQTYDWALKIFIPKVFAGRTMGLNISTQYRVPTNISEFDSEKVAPKLVNTQGAWSTDQESKAPIYTVVLPKQDDIVYNIFLDLPSNILSTEKIGYVTSTQGKNQGPLELKSAQHVLRQPVTVNELTVSAS